MSRKPSDPTSDSSQAQPQAPQALERTAFLTSEEVNRLPPHKRKAIRVAKQRECARLKALGYSLQEIGEKINSSRKHVQSLLAREYSLPGPDTETLRGIEQRKLDMREQRANQMYLSNLLYEEKTVEGRRMTVQVVPPNVLGQYGAEMDRVASKRYRILGLEVPIKHIFEQDIDARFADLQARLTPEAMEHVIDVFSGNLGGQEVEGATRPGEGRSTSH